MSMLREKFSARLRVIRAERGLSQENLAEMLNMSLNGYAKIERGESDVSLNKIEAIAKALEVESGDLLQIQLSDTSISNAQRRVSQGADQVSGLLASANPSGRAEWPERLLERIVRLETRVEDMLRVK